MEPTKLGLSRSLDPAQGTLTCMQLAGQCSNMRGVHRCCRRYGLATRCIPEECHCQPPRLRLCTQVAAYIMVKQCPLQYAPLPAALFLGHLALGTYWNGAPCCRVTQPVQHSLSSCDTHTVVFFGKQKLRESLAWMGAFVASVFGEAPTQ